MLNKILDPIPDKKNIETILPSLDCNNCDQFPLSALAYINYYNTQRLRTAPCVGWGVTAIYGYVCHEG